MKVTEGNFEGKEVKIAIIVSRFNDKITSRLLDSAYDTLIRHNVSEKNISIYRVPGSFEIPLIAKRIAKSNKSDAIICLGALIRGETPHFEFISSEVVKGIANVSTETGVPLIYGVITADTVEQAMDRAGIKLGNRGREAALSALEMVDLIKKL